MPECMLLSTFKGTWMYTHATIHIAVHMYVQVKHAVSQHPHYSRPQDMLRHFHLPALRVSCHSKNRIVIAYMDDIMIIEHLKLIKLVLRMKPRPSLS